MSNIKDVARISGVSPSTVSNVFSNKRPVNAKTRELVLRVSRELDYQPSLMASGNITKRTNIYGFFFEPNSTTYSNVDSDILKGCIIGAANVGKRLVAYYNLKDQREIRSSLRLGCQPIDGAVLILPYVQDFRLDELNKKTIPCVLIGKPPETFANCMYVDVHNTNIAYKMTKKLISLGHTKIAMINYKRGYVVTDDRVNGYLRAFKDSGLMFDPALVFNTGQNEQDGIETAERLLQSKTFFSAALVSMPSVAAGFYRVLKKYGLQIGKDISIVSFNPDVKGLVPTLSSSNPEYEQMGMLAIEALDTYITNPENAKQKLYLEPEFTYTDSCQPLNPMLHEKLQKLPGV